MKISVLVLVFLIPHFVVVAAPVAPHHLKVDYITNPLGIDDTLPHFSWINRSEADNFIQHAYELIVCTDTMRTGAGKHIVWSTGKVISEQSNNIIYGGSPLKALTRYFFKVRIYDSEQEVSSWSNYGWFETGMLTQSKWKAQWISDGKAKPVRSEDYFLPDSMPLFRKSFPVSGQIESARLYITGLGYFEAYLNGKKISEDVLSPAFSTYNKRVYYRVYDVKDFLGQGNNLAAIMLGNGWWNPLPIKFFGAWDLRNFQQTGRPCTKAEIHLKYKDGRTDKIVTDASWQYTPGPVIHNSVYLGEVYDARNLPAGWNTTNKSSVQWKNAALAGGAAGNLVAQTQPPIQVTRILKPVSIWKTKNEKWIVDFGQNFAGVVRIKVDGEAGKKISIKLGEDIFKDSSLNYHTSVMTQIQKGVISGGPGAPENAWQLDEYILKGNGLEVWQPRFTFHVFRYAEITGWPGKPTAADFEGLRMNSAVEPAGEFLCANEQLNKLHEAIQYTFLSNLFSVQSDCPGREKMGYGADIVVTANSYMYNYDMAQFYRKTINDFANEQRPLGGITEIAPFTGIADRGYGDNSGPLGWQLVFPYLQMQLYQFYGDSSVIRENYPALKKQMAFLQSKAIDGLFHWDISDHEALDPRPEAFTASLFYYHHAQLATQFASILTLSDDSIFYSKLATNIKERIIRKYAVPNTGRFDNATQSAQLFALHYNIATDTSKTWKVFLQELERHNWHISTGIFSTQMFFQELIKRKEPDLLYKVATQQDFPGWLYMLNKGATTLWETWAYPEKYASQNHPMFGSIEEWFYSGLLGINQAAPGFRKIIISPQPPAALAWAEGSYRSAHGIIKSSWKRTDDRFNLKVSIPANTTATIHLPAKSLDYTKNGVKATSNSLINGCIVISVGSGNYAFTSTY